MRLNLLGGLLPIKPPMRDTFAGVTLASLNIPQVLGHTHRRNAGRHSLYTVLLPLVAFAVFGSSRHLIVAADRPPPRFLRVPLVHGRGRQANITWCSSAWSRCDRRSSRARPHIQARLSCRFSLAHRADRSFSPGSGCRSGRRARRHARGERRLAANARAAWQVLQGLPSLIAGLGLSLLSGQHPAR